MRITRLLALVLVAGLSLVTPALAQQQVFIQIEAHPSLTEAQKSIRSYGDRFRNLNGFALRSGWFGIAIGPYPESEAESLLFNLRVARVIPADSYIARGGDFQSQFWPAGVTWLPRTALPDLPQTDLPDSTPDIPDETVREARAGEARLSREERAEVQEALAWAGFYEGGIDAAFGPGTRNAMSRWQEASALPATGVLTTRQRAQLMGAYNAVLDGLTLTKVDDTEAGISMTLPTGAVAFDRYDAPFAHYQARGDLDAQVLLISQPGNRATLAGLYEVLQTLEIVPLSGPRELRAGRFEISGENTQHATHVEATLDNGEIKGFALVWPAGDEDRRSRVLGIMQESFARLEGVLDPATGSDAALGMDLLAGLEIRQPVRTRSGFFVDRRGWVVTTADAVSDCTRVTLDGTFEAQVETMEAASGLALLRPVEALAPGRVATFAGEAPRLRSDVAVAGYSYGGRLGAPSVTFGTLADLTGLDGETDVKRLALNARDSDAGGPVLSDGGAVLGVLLPSKTGDRMLPDGVSFAAGPERIASLLAAAGITPGAAQNASTLPPETLRQQAASMTVLVSCWQ